MGGGWGGGGGGGGKISKLAQECSRKRNRKKKSRWSDPPSWKIDPPPPPPPFQKLYQSPAMVHLFLAPLFTLSLSLSLSLSLYSLHHRSTLLPSPLHLQPTSPSRPPQLSFLTFAQQPHLVFAKLK